MGKFKFLIRTGSYYTGDVKEKFDFMLVHYPYWDDMGYLTRFHLYGKSGSHIAYQFHILCSYQSPREKSRLIEFESPYKIIEELPSSFATAMNENQYFKLCHYLPNGEDRKDFADLIEVIGLGMGTHSGIVRWIQANCVNPKI